MAERSRAATTRQRASGSFGRATSTSREGSSGTPRTRGICLSGTPEEHPHFIVGENELVMNLTAQSLKDEFLGRVCLTRAGERCLLNQRIARLTPNAADPRFVMYAFKSRRFRVFVNSLNKGSLIQHMFTSQLAEYALPLPPLEEQRRIVAEVEQRLSAIDALRAAIERAQRRSAALRRAVLERAFRGELVPQDPSDEPASVLLARIRAERATAAASSTRRRKSQ